MTRAAIYFATRWRIVSDRIAGREDRGATTVEYGLLVGLIAVVIIMAATVLRGQWISLFEAISDGFSAA